MVWFVITFILWLEPFVTLAKSAIFSFLPVASSMLSAANFTGELVVLRASSSLDIVTASAAFDAATVDLYLLEYT
ncbi:hypothetical protein FRB96_000789 [Tulasnella sp. 330]|nr:hypothetical protein FRB96_000789 [Tulasnella sp. 330]